MTMFAIKVTMIEQADDWKTAVMLVSVHLPVVSSRISATGFCFSLIASVVAEDDEEDTNKPTSSEKIC